MEEGGLSLRPAAKTTETGECEWFMIVSLHWLDEDYVPRACILDMRDVPSDMNDTSLPESSLTVYLRGLSNKWEVMDKTSAVTYDNKIGWESTICEVSPRILHVPCHIVILNKSVETCLDDCEPISS
ncbi:hypothetical protein MVEG_03798 [Podila verticillata NRRL 6337]|nr:hypothetical protein MVEG_03798 [Podila verticillata NRRL 6337]